MSTSTIDISQALTVQGWMEPIELEWLAEMAAKVPEGGLIAEIGSYKGRSACAIAGNTKAVLYCIDIWSECGTDGWYYDVFLKNTAHLTNIAPYNHASIYAARKFAQAKKRFAAVFLDGAHDQYNLRQDIAAWKPLLAEGSVFCGHDYLEPVWPDVKPVVDELVGPVDVVGRIWIAKNSSQEN